MRVHIFTEAMIQKILVCFHPDMFRARSLPEREGIDRRLNTQLRDLCERFLARTALDLFRNVQCEPVFGKILCKASLLYRVEH